MSTLFFDLMSQFDEDPDWSRSPIAWANEDQLARMYERKFGIGKKAKGPNTQNQYRWLKPPEDTKSQERGIHAI